MKLPKIFNFPGAILMLVLACAPVANGALPNMQISGPAHEVVRMVSSGVPDEVIRAYVEATPAMFNLTSDNIINLQGSGVSSALLTAMLTHDKTVRDNANAYYASATAPQPPAMTPTAPPQPTPDESYATETADNGDYYGALSPYGNWNYLPGYGWGWQGYPGLGYDYYPWGVLGFGFWFDCPGRGWCWFPNSRFGSFNRFNHFDHFNRFGAFAGNRFDGRFRAGANFGARQSFGGNRSFAGNRSFGVNRSSAGFRGFSPAMGHFGGGQVSTARFGGSHFSGGGGSHFSGGGGGMHGGGGGGGHR